MKEKRGEVEYFCSWTQVSGSPSHTFPPPRLCGRLGFPCIQTRTLHGRDGRQPPPHSVALCITWVRWWFGISYNVPADALILTQTGENSEVYLKVFSTTFDAVRNITPVDSSEEIFSEQTLAKIEKKSDQLSWLLVPPPLPPWKKSSVFQSRQESTSPPGTQNSRRACL